MKARDHLARDRCAVIVLGKADEILNGQRRVSPHLRHRVEAAEQAAARFGAEIVIFSGGTTSGGISEARQMAGLWRGAGGKLILEENSQDTAENAALCLPLVLSTDLRRVVVVSCSWHVRARAAFAPYRQYGLRVAFFSAHDPWPMTAKKLAWELMHLPRLWRRLNQTYSRALLG